MNHVINTMMRVGLLAGALLGSLPLQAADNKDLSKVREQIQQKQQDIKSQKKTLDQLHQQLRQDEKAVTTLAARLSSTQAKLSTTRKQLAKLEQRRQQLNDQLKRQERMLAQQLDHAYRMGQNDYLKLLLNQQDPVAIGRALDYYGYVNQARLQAISELKKTQEELSYNRQQTAKTSTELSAIVQSQKQDKLALQQKQQSREATVDEIKKSLSADQQQLAKLQAAEKEMQRKIEEARKKLEAERKRKKAEALARARAKAREQGRSEAAAEAQAAATIALGDHKGLGKLRGQLPWPLRGQLVRRFGEHRGGEVTWKGILIGAGEGAPVKAIADGDVVFADWLEGFGNVLVVDHGFGYLSLYGNNSALLKRSGQSVNRGETIAQVGNSGGQPQSGLYFEIRWQGKPVNPVTWLGH
ncbi:MAG: murein hydrolase activator EnvC [Aeromonadaceae bacterium]